MAEARRVDGGKAPAADDDLCSEYSYYEDDDNSTKPVAKPVPPAKQPTLESISLAHQGSSAKALPTAPKSADDAEYYDDEYYDDGIPAPAAAPPGAAARPPAPPPGSVKKAVPFEKPAAAQPPAAAAPVPAAALASAAEVLRGAGGGRRGGRRDGQGHLLALHRPDANVGAGRGE